MCSFSCTLYQVRNHLVLVIRFNLLVSIGCIFIHFRDLEKAVSKEMLHEFCQDGFELHFFPVFSFFIAQELYLFVV